MAVLSLVYQKLLQWWPSGCRNSPKWHWERWDLMTAVWSGGNPDGQTRASIAYITASRPSWVSGGGGKACRLANSGNGTALTLLPEVIMTHLPWTCWTCWALLVVCICLFIGWLWISMSSSLACNVALLFSCSGSNLQIGEAQWMWLSSFLRVECSSMLELITSRVVAESCWHGPLLVLV